jgi:zinc-ribbon domain
MFCPSCGNQNPDQATQCGRCGAQLQAAPKPQKFKGTMMMSSAADIIAPGFQGGPTAPQPFAQPATPERATSPDDMIDAPTIMQAPGEMPGAYMAQRAALTQPQGTGNVNATMAMDASAFGLIGNAPAAPPEPSVQEVGASTMAVDASAFGLGAPSLQNNPPGPPRNAPPPNAWGAPPQGPPPQQQAMPPQQPEISTGGIASTVAVDISQFGLGGAGAPANPYGGPQGPQGYPQQQQQQGPQNFGGYNPQGMQQGMNPGMQQGMNPGMQQGMNPGMQQGMNPGMQQGMNPGMQQQGWAQQQMAPLRPPPSSVSPGGKSNTTLILVMVFLVLVLMGAGAGMYFLRR